MKHCNSMELPMEKLIPKFRFTHFPRRHRIYLRPVLLGFEESQTTLTAHIVCFIPPIIQHLRPATIIGPGEANASGVFDLVFWRQCPRGNCYNCTWIPGMGPLVSLHHQRWFCQCPQWALIFNHTTKQSESWSFIETSWLWCTIFSLVNFPKQMSILLERWVCGTESLGGSMLCIATCKSRCTQSFHHTLNKMFSCDDRRIQRSWSLFYATICSNLNC